MSKKLDAITSREEDFAQWYTDIVKKAELISYSSVRGCVILRPYGYGIWENMQRELDARLKATGHENVYMPMFIKESLLEKEKEHVEGFAPEVAWVTRGGHDELTERLLVRPTSETIFCEHYSEIIESYRDLPKLYNQWANVVRWEKTTRPFLRTLEFLWQEGHTAHATEEEAEEEAVKMLNVYIEFCKNVLAIPVVSGQKTENEKFAGAKHTYTIESLMYDGKALQSGTTHNFSDGFAKAFDITFTDRDNTIKHVFQSSWGVTTRLIGALIMVHSDDNGLILPPKVAPTQVAIVPVMQKKEGVIEKCNEVAELLSTSFRVKVDVTDKTPGWKFSEYEMKGVPIRLEMGPRDIENNACIIARRDTSEKVTVSLDNLVEEISKILEDIHNTMYSNALKRLNEKTYRAVNMDEFEKILDETPGFIKAMWCGDLACELAIKEKTGATARCIPFEQDEISNKCICCDKDAKQMVYFARAY